MTRRHYWLSVYPKKELEDYPKFVYVPNKKDPNGKEMSLEEQEVQYFFGPEKRVQALKNMLQKLQKLQNYSHCSCYVSSRGHEKDAERLLTNAGLKDYFKKIHSTIDARTRKIHFLQNELKCDDKGDCICIYVDDDTVEYKQAENLGIRTFQIGTQKEQFHMNGQKDGTENLTIQRMEDLVEFAGGDDSKKFEKKT